MLWNVDRQRFIAGSSGVEYALIAFLAGRGWIGDVEPPTPTATDRIVVLSGSCSPVTQQQIEYAERNGFTSIRLDAPALGSGEGVPAAAEQAQRATLSALMKGRSVVLFTAASPQDRIESFSSQAEERRFRQSLSMQAGKILNRVLDESGVTRIVVAGGDTSSHAGQQLGIDALTYLGPLRARRSFMPHMVAFTPSTESRNCVQGRAMRQSEFLRNGIERIAQQGELT